MIRKVLIIDDDDQVRETLQLRLESDDFQVVTAAGGIEGIHLAETEHPSLIVLDLTMPDIDGLELLDKLRKDVITWDTPVIVCTAKGDSESRETSRRLGVSRFLRKPISPRYIVSEITRLLQRAGT